MNASYKIVLLGAFVLFAAVVSYYIFSGDGQADNPLGDDYAQEDTTPGIANQTAPPPRPVLEPIRPTPEPEPEPEPVVEVETIGQTPDELPPAPVIESFTGGTPTRPAPEETTQDPTTQDPAIATEESPETESGPRRAPEPETDDPVELPTEPEAEPEVEPSPRPVPPTPTSIPRTYTVQEGDTFGSIALEFYGEERMWYEIAQANPTIDPKRLQIGQVIVLPNKEAEVREREEVQPPTPGKDQNYTVRPGDNLSKIAKRFYGDAEKWDLIYARNRNLIGPRPNDLKVGMELVIPQVYNGAE